MNEIINIVQYKPKKKVVYMCKILKKIQNKSAVDLLKEYSIDLKPPIDVSLLLEKIGISTIARDFSKEEKLCGYEPNTILGAAISNEDDLAIFFRENDTYHRKMFTVAHELGHCCLHHDTLKIEHIEYRTTGLNDKDKHEIEADLFAGELLIPDDIISNVYKKLILPSLKVLSDYFDVSTYVMAARLDHLNLNYYKDIEINEE